MRLSTLLEKAVIDMSRLQKSQNVPRFLSRHTKKGRSLVVG
jgi:hypothetical protein